MRGNGGLFIISASFLKKKLLVMWFVFQCSVHVADLIDVLVLLHSLTSSFGYYLVKASGLGPGINPSKLKSMSEETKNQIRS